MTLQPQPFESSLLASETRDALQRGLRVTRQIHLVMVLGALLFGGVVAAIVHGRLDPEASATDAVALAAGVIAGGSIIFALFAPRIARSMTPGRSDAANALPRYQVVCLMRWVVLDGAVLFSAVGTLLAGSRPCFVVYGVSVAFLAYYWPSRRELIRLFLR